MDHLSKKEVEGASKDLKQERMDDSWEKEAKAGLSKYDLQQNSQKKSHKFQFRFKNNTYTVTCDTSMTVLEALDTNNIFKNIKKKNMEKEIVIQRSKGEVPRAAVKTDFPCCLIEKDESLKITFIKNTENASAEEKPTVDVSNPDSFVTFYIHTTGGEIVKRLMKNKNLRLNVDDVCVYAFKGENFITALRRDGRFIDDIFKKLCALSEMDSETIHEMSNNVEHFGQMHFRVIFISDIDQPDSQYNTKTESDSVASNSTLTENADPSLQFPINTKKEKTQRRKTTKKKPSPKMEIPNSAEILGILRDQSKDLLETLKQRENLRNNSEVQSFFREEYDKSVQSFSKVRKVKEIMRLSESVCQIRVEGSPSIKATGFLLFGKFILTNAHVIKNFNLFTWRIHDPIKAAFNFEKKSDKGNITVMPVKDTLAAYHFGKEGENYFDFALLELNEEIPKTLPRLLKSYSKDNSTTTGEICIVGHPNGEVKKTDPCFIIGRENRQQAEMKHVSENIKFYHFMTQNSMKEKWSFSKNQWTYHSCFFHGSSGSPVFDRKCRLIGIHTGGYVYPGEGGETRSVMEYAYAMEPILDKITFLAEEKKRTDILEYLNDSNNYLNMTTQPQGDQEMVDVSQITSS